MSYPIEKTNNSRVFVVQDQHRWDEKTRTFVPKFNTQPAVVYGELCSLLSPKAAPFDPVHIVAELHKKLASFTDADFLLLIGNPVLIGLAVAIAAYHNEGRVQVLQWSGKDQGYVAIFVDLEGELEDV